VLVGKEWLEILQIANAWGFCESHIVKGRQAKNLLGLERQVEYCSILPSYMVKGGQEKNLPGSERCKELATLSTIVYCHHI
jgi:hypothetical protein